MRPEVNRPEGVAQQKGAVCPALLRLRKRRAPCETAAMSALAGTQVAGAAS